MLAQDSVPTEEVESYTGIKFGPRRYMRSRRGPSEELSRPSGTTILCGRMRNMLKRRRTKAQFFSPIFCVAVKVLKTEVVMSNLPLACDNALSFVMHMEIAKEGATIR